jgi:beta-mannosidase
MFRTYRVNVKPYLLASNNTMSIVFKSAVNHDNQMAALDFPMVIPSDNDRIYSRKAAYHYGWDWGPRLVTAGIWRPLYLEAWNNAKIESVYFMQQSVSNSSASINTQANIEVNITGSYTLKVINTETNAVYAQ